MRQIAKRPEPPSLTAHRLTPHCDYGNYPAKVELRGALVAEQRSLCCYCMKRIRAEVESVKIEHWRSQTNYPDDQLSYQNLLAGCKGGEGQRVELQHCDTRKGNAEIQWNPANPVHHVETRITYASDGTVRANDPAFDAQLNDVLNLNLPHLKNNRKSVLTGILEWWQAERSRLQARVPKVRMEREIEHRTRPDGDLTPYCQVAVWWLQQKLAGMA